MTSLCCSYTKSLETGFRVHGVTRVTVRLQLSWMLSDFLLNASIATFLNLWSSITLRNVASQRLMFAFLRVCVDFVRSFSIPLTTEEVTEKEAEIC